MKDQARMSVLLKTKDESGSGSESTNGNEG